MNLTAEPPRCKESGIIRPHTRFKNPTEGRHDCAMDVSEQFRDLENGEGLSTVVGESESGDDIAMEDVTNVDPRVEKEGVTDEQYEIRDEVLFAHNTFFVPGKKHEGAEESPSARGERVWKEGEQDDRVEVFPEVWKTELALEVSQRNNFDENFPRNSWHTDQSSESSRRGVLYHRWRQRTHHSGTLKGLVERERGKHAFERKVFRTPFESGDSVWAFSPHKRRATSNTNGKQAEPPEVEQTRRRKRRRRRKRPTPQNEATTSGEHEDDEDDQFVSG